MTRRRPGPSTTPEAAALQRGMRARSAGLHADPGTTPPPLAIEIAREFGVEVAHHRALPLVGMPAARDGLIFCFERSHVRAILQTRQFQPGNVFLLGDLLTPRWPHIEDPYGRPPPYFRYCFERIAAAVQNLASIASAQ